MQKIIIGGKLKYESYKLSCDPTIREPSKEELENKITWIEVDRKDLIAAFKSAAVEGERQ